MNQKETILIIDDEKEVLKSLCEYLEDLEYTVHKALDGKKGLEIYEEQEPDIVITDLRMEPVTGFDVIREVTRRSPSKPVIAVSGTSDIEQTIEAHRLGAWDYIIKPIHKPELISDSLRKVKERRRLLLENKKYQNHLEKLVLDRTEELKEANKILNLTNQKLKRSLDEKDILLKEINHRVKNNLQVIISLLNLQKEQTEPAVQNILLDVIGRIRIFSDIHANLYQENNLSEINFKKYLIRDFAYIKKQFHKDTNAFQIKVDISRENLNISTAITLGLLCHELMTNSFKHSLEESGEIHITLNLKENSKVNTMIYRDTGTPPGDHQKGFGFTIIEAMTKQLNLSLKDESQGAPKYVFENGTGQEDRSSSRTGEIIFVEDEILIAQSRIKGLQQAGFNVSEQILRSGEETIDYYKSLTKFPSLIIIDISLEGEIDGIECIRQIKQIDPEIPVIFISGYENNDILNQINRFKNSLFLKKTCSFAELIRGISELRIQEMKQKTMT